MWTVCDKYKATFDPGLEERNPWVALCRNTYWICPLDSSSMYSYTRQLLTRISWWFCGYILMSDKISLDSENQWCNRFQSYFHTFGISLLFCQNQQHRKFQILSEFYPWLGAVNFHWGIFLRSWYLFTFYFLICQKIPYFQNSELTKSKECVFFHQVLPFVKILLGAL